MELEADDGNHLRRGRLMAAIRFVFTIDYVAEILDEDVDLLREIISNDDNLTYGNIISVVTGDDESTPALTDEHRRTQADADRGAKITRKMAGVPRLLRPR